MRETSLNITIYTQPECKESERTIAEFLVEQVAFTVKDISDPESYLALESLVKSVSTPKNVVTPTVVAECSCGKHVEWWSAHNVDRRDHLFAMLRHLNALNISPESQQA